MSTRTTSPSSLQKTFEFTSFEDAMARMHRCSYDIVHLDHHPEWINIYNRVLVTLSTHSANNTVTSKDHDLAKILDEQYSNFLNS